ncbi:MAG: ParB N-terminal domain-containing protein [Eggerthellaceae bacterium]|nr:ParB N-terminal domain-containing protein [Eggerthellaceae bacterium]
MSSKRNFKKAMQESGAGKAYVNSTMHEEMTDEQVREAAFQSRRNQDCDISQKMADDNRRNTLLRKSGFDWVDIEELQPHPDNAYHVTEEDVENLAGLIYISKETQPLVVRETEDGLQIIDGERRWRAHKLLARLYGDAWRMVPARIHPLDSLTEEEVHFILHSNNAGQREKTASEKAMGLAAIADSLIEWRKANPALKGVRTNAMLAEHFGVSERTAQTNLTIARGLTQRCCKLLDDKALTMAQAETIARLSEEKQEAIADAIESGDFEKNDIDDLIQNIKEDENTTSTTGGSKAPTTRKLKEKTTNSLMRNAKNALRKAIRKPEDPDPVLVAELKEYVLMLDKRVNEKLQS